MPRKNSINEEYQVGQSELYNNIRVDKNTVEFGEDEVDKA